MHGQLMAGVAVLVVTWILQRVLIFQAYAGLDPAIRHRLSQETAARPRLWTLAFAGALVGAMVLPRYGLLLAGIALWGSQAAQIQRLAADGLPPAFVRRLRLASAVAAIGYAAIGAAVWWEGDPAPPPVAEAPAP